MSKPPTIHERLDEQANTLSKILTQTTATNGRVTRIEGDLYGDAEHQVAGVKGAVKKLTDADADRRAVGKAVNRWGAVLAGLGGGSFLIEVARWFASK